MKADRTEKQNARHRGHRVLGDAQTVQTAMRALARQCPGMAAIASRTGTPELRTWDTGLKGLARIVTGQQLSAQSAAAIWARVSAAIVPFEAAALVRCSDAELGRLGLSRGKVATLRALADAIEAGEFDLDAIDAAAEDDIVTSLTAIRGIGPWSAQIYLIFALRRADAFAPGDLALQLAAQRLFALPSRPSANELSALAERWRPWRGMAARLLWADYAWHKAQPAAKGAAPAPQRGRRAAAKKAVTRPKARKASQS